MISRYAKVKTKKGSEEKNFLKRQAFSNANTSSLHLPCRSTWLAQHSFFFRPATFKKTIKRVLGYATLKYGYYMGQAVQNRQTKVFNCPAKPSDKDMDDDPDGAKYWCQVECKDMMAEKRGYTSNLRKMLRIDL